MFIKNFDWPANNSNHWKMKNEEDKWRYLFYDLDAAFGNYNYNMFEHMSVLDTNVIWPNSPSATFLFRKLIENDDFKNQFIDRYAEVLNTEFQSDTLRRKLNKIVEQFEHELPRHISRWNYPESVSNWKEIIDEEIVTFIENRPCAVERHIIEFFNLNSFGFACIDSTVVQSSDILFLTPNPNDGNFFIYNNSSEDLIGDMLITNILGENVYLENNVVLEKNVKRYFKFSTLPSNTYIVVFRNEKIREVKKMIVINRS